MSIMSWRSSEKKSESHGCCHYCQYFLGGSAVNAGDGRHSRFSGSLVRGGQFDGGAKDRAGYVDYREVKSRIKSGSGVLFLSVSASLLTALFCVLLVKLVTGNFGDSFLGEFLDLALRLSGSSFRSDVVDVGAVVAGAEVALAALSWRQHKRPAGEGVRRVGMMWLIDVFDDARREDIAADLMCVLTACFGALVVAFWVSVFAAQYCGIQVDGDVFVGIVLIFTSGVIALLPLLSRPSGNGVVRDYAVALQNVVSWVRWGCVSKWMTCRGRVSVPRAVGGYAVTFAISAVMFGLAWWACAGVGAVGFAILYGMVCCLFVWLMVEDVPNVILSKPFARFAAIFNFISVSIAAFVLPSFVAVLKFGVGGAWPTMCACIVWLIVMYLFMFRGIKVPVLAGLMCFRLCRYQNALKRIYLDLVEGEMLHDRDELGDVANILIPMGSVILMEGEKPPGVSCAKVWSRRAGAMVPEEGKPRRPGPHAVDLRAYVAETLGIVLPGTGTPALPSRVRSSNSAIDEWHIDSSY